MQNMKILNKKEIKNILSALEKQFNSKAELDYAFLMNERDKIYLANKEIFDFNIDKLRISSFGFYFAQFRDNEIRLSIEGSQLIGPSSTKNIVELNDKEAREWLKGYDLDKTTDNQSFVLIKNNNDFLGCGKQIKDRIMNYVPKNRRIRASD